MRTPAGTIRSPNIWEHPDLYETENRALDPDGVLDAAITELVGQPSGWGHVLDIGAGTGFHLPGLAAVAARVTGVEPHPRLAAAAAARVRRLTNVTVRQGVAQALPVPDSSVDVAHARWAYFFGPGCEPGLTELARVCRRGGLAVILDHDATRSAIGHAFAAGLRSEGVRYDPGEVERFWARRGFRRRCMEIRWRFATAAELAAVLRIEFPRPVADAAVAEVTRVRAERDTPAGQAWEIGAAVNLWHRRY